GNRDPRGLPTGLLDSSVLGRSPPATHGEKVSTRYLPRLLPRHNLSETADLPLPAAPPRAALIRGAVTRRAEPPTDLPASAAVRGAFLPSDSTSTPWTSTPWTAFASV